MSNCSFLGCFNGTGNGVKLHSFPKNEDRRKIWLKQCRENLKKSLTERSVLCDAHFNEEQFEQNRSDGKKFLRWNAIPTIFNVAPEVEKIPVKRRIPLTDCCENSPSVSKQIEVQDQSDDFERPRHSLESEHREKVTAIGEHFTSIAETLVKYKKRGFLCDAILVAKCGKELKAHSALLAAGSPFFMNALIADQISDGSHQLYFPDLEFDVLEIAVNYVYTGKLILPSVYLDKGQLSKLLVKLNGLSLSKLHGCEITFEKKLKLPVVTVVADDLSIDRSVVEHSYHKTVLKGSFRKTKLPEYKKAAASAVNESENISDTKCPNDIDDFSAAGLLNGCAQATDSSTKHPKSVKPNSRFKPRLKPFGNKVKNKKCQYVTCVSTSDLQSCSFKPVLDENTHCLSALESQSYHPDGLQFFDTRIMADDHQQQMFVSETKETFVCEFCPEQDRKEFNTIFKLLCHRMKCSWYQCHKCLYCERTFSSVQTLRSHIGRHTGIQPPKTKKTYVCDECGLFLDTRGKFESHKLRHTGKKPYECNICARKFALKAVLDRHRRVHSELKKPFLCNFCGKAYAIKFKLQQHMNKHHHHEMKVHECAFCGCRLTSRTEMEKHVVEDHQLSNLEDINSAIKTPLTYLCNLCGNSFVSASSLSRHIVLHDTKPTRCDICLKELKTHRALLIHKRRHTGERPFVCNICKKGFMQTGALMQHLGTHSETKRFICVICSKGYSTKVNVQQHMRMHTLHSGERPYNGVKSYACNVCSKRFISKATLTIHNRIHTGEKPFKCTVCSRFFADGSQLKAHIRTHTGEKPFICRICSKSYKNKPDLRYHYTRFHKLEVKKEFVNFRSVYSFDFDQKCETVEKLADESHGNSGVLQRAEDV